MLDPYFINSKDLKALSILDNNVEDTKTDPVIILVQRSVIRPITGTSLYKRLVEGVNNGDLSTLENTLMNDYIIPLLLVAIPRAYINVGTYSIRNKTVGKAVDPNIQAVTQEENLRLDNMLRGYAKVEQDTLIGYLVDNGKDFPQYDNEECNYENVKPRKTKTGDSGFYML